MVDSNTIDKIISEKVNDAISDVQLKEMSEIVQDYLNSSNLDISQEQFEVIVNLIAITSKITAKHSTIASVNTINELMLLND